MDISIRTAQHVNIVYQPAGLVNRIGATLIDLAFLGGIYILCFTLASLSSIFRNTTTAIILSVILMCYHFVCEYFFHGRSLGKLTLHLSWSYGSTAESSLFWNCLLRWILRLVDISVSMGILAMLSIIISSKMQRLGDLAAGTTVIHEKKDTDLRRISSFETSESYQPTFPQIAMLSDKDMAIVREVFREFEKNKEYKLLEPLSAKIKELTGIETHMNNLQFIQTILTDYIHLTK